MPRDIAVTSGKLVYTDPRERTVNMVNNTQIHKYKYCDVKRKLILIAFVWRMMIIKENCEEVRVEELQLLSWKAKGFNILSYMYFCICVLRIPHLENDNTNYLFVKCK